MELRTTTLPDELALACWPQWHVNGHDLDAALRTVAVEHQRDDVRALAVQAIDDAARYPIVRAAFASVLWEREREACRALRG